MRPKPLPPIEYLNECLSYDPLTGELFWKARPRSHFKDTRGFKTFNSQMAGTVAGNKHWMKGRPHSVVITLNYQRYYAHRIIYALFEVPVPDGYEIDHRDVNPWNNRLSNLRLATHAQNSQNQKRHSDRTNDLPKGVSIRSDGKKFVSYITKNGVVQHLGSFSTVALARAAYEAKAIELHGEFAQLD